MIKCLNKKVVLDLWRNKLSFVARNTRFATTSMSKLIKIVSISQQGYLLIKTNNKIIVIIDRKKQNNWVFTEERSLKLGTYINWEDKR